MADPAGEALKIRLQLRYYCYSHYPDYSPLQTLFVNRFNGGDPERLYQADIRDVSRRETS